MWLGTILPVFMRLFGLYLSALACEDPYLECSMAPGLHEHLLACACIWLAVNHKACKGYVTSLSWHDSQMLFFHFVTFYSYLQ
jgi:hypothetical protein